MWLQSSALIMALTNCYVQIWITPSSHMYRSHIILYNKVTRLKRQKTCKSMFLTLCSNPVSNKVENFHMGTCDLSNCRINIYCLYFVTQESALCMFYQSMLYVFNKSIRTSISYCYSSRYLLTKNSGNNLMHKTYFVPNHNKQCNIL